MPRIKLTHRDIATLEAGKWLTDFWGASLPGFGLRVHHSGRKTFFVRYSTEEGAKRRLTLGHYPTLSLVDARTQVIGYLALGEDPQAEKAAERSAETFGELATEYLERHGKVKKRRWREDERILKVDLLPAWRRKKAKNLARRDVSDLLDGIVERGAPIMANRVRALISKIYNFGVGRGIVEHNPCLGVPVPAKARQRDHVLTSEEIRSLWDALDQEHPVMAATIRMRLLTAQRGNEVLAMRWQHIDVEWWTIPAESAKNGLAHRVPLAPHSVSQRTACAKQIHSAQPL